MKQMKTNATMMALLPAAFLAFGWSSSANAQPVEGAIEAEVVKASFTVDAIDATKRTVTLKNADGATRTVKCGKEVVNFDQIKVGDKVTVAVMESIAVVVRAKGGPPNAGEGVAVALAPKGAKPGAIMAETSEITAKVDAVDATKRTVTLEGPLGKQRTFRVGPKADLSAIKKGDDIVLRVTDALAIEVTSGAQ